MSSSQYTYGRNQSFYGSKIDRLAFAVSDSLHTQGILKSNNPKAKKNAPLVGTPERSPTAVDGFVRALFLNSPLAVFDERSEGSLIELASWCCEHFHAFGESDCGPVKIASQRDDTQMRMCICVRDRPFIINTVSQVLDRFAIKPLLFLHPVLPHGLSMVSFSYFEFQNLTPERLTQFESALYGALLELVPITDDFPAMMELSLNLAKICHAAASHDRSLKNSRGVYADYEAAAQILEWLCDSSFIFLGSARWEMKGSLPSNFKAQECHGVLRPEAQLASDIQRDCIDDVNRLLQGSEAFCITKLSSQSIVHRSARMTHIAIRIPNSPDASSATSVAQRNGESSKREPQQQVQSFIGLLTSQALIREASNVPLVRTKMQAILERESVRPNSHDFKSIINIIDSMPKDEALILDSEALQEEIRTILHCDLTKESKALIRFDPSRRNAWVMVAVPRDRFHSEVRKRIQQILEQSLQAEPNSADYHFTSVNHRLHRFYFSVPTTKSCSKDLDVPALEKQLEIITLSWEDRLAKELRERDPANADELLGIYHNAFTADYQARTEVHLAADDIAVCERLGRGQQVCAAFQALEPHSSLISLNDSSLSLTLARYGTDMSLSETLPSLECCGFLVIREEPSIVRPRDRVPIFLHRFSLKLPEGTSIEERRLQEVVAPGLEEILAGSRDSDPLNALMLRGGLSIRSIAFLRTYCRLLWQMHKQNSRYSMFIALSGYPEAARQLWQLFQTKFDSATKLNPEERLRACNQMIDSFNEWLRSVSDITHDRILRNLASLIAHTVRTNFFLNYDTIALKVDSQKLDFLPPGRPLCEIFVCAPTFEGVHLRSSRVARGGIRWSERIDDYRTEILGLVRTQKIKNVVIVPSGAKGGFIVRTLPPSREAAEQAVVDAYKQFIRALLALTDNRVGETIQHPEGLVIYDDPDPYLVVAADKGTARFSDIANEIAVKEFNFWLGDAFASGGSNGYDHKRFGVTARGSWEAARIHLRTLGIDYEREPFSVIGIGDMSGDVFGNGLLLSPHMKLLAAFNHKHIFIDPNPDLAVAFQERHRLFALPHSQWSDYNRELISAGGGVFSRMQKEVSITPQMREVLGLPDTVANVVSGEQLVSLVLKAPCDLLWNGGIGTYVKSRIESDVQVDDGTNDRVRINADELRARAVAEGGNLGFTQLARVEYAQSGGRINTDAIDNSAGVDLSDHEVNIKILLSQVERDGILSRDDRNQLLEEIAPDVVRAVLSHNFSQSLVLTAAERRSRKKIEYFQSLIQDLARFGYLNRSLENLPDDEQLQERAKDKLGLVRPELAVCLATVKMWVNDQLVSQPDILNSAIFSEYLIDYFPQPLVQQYRKYILSHPLASHIIATQVSNELIDAVGISFIHRMCANFSVNPAVVLHCLATTMRILQVEKLRQDVKALETHDTFQAYLHVKREKARALREATAWFLGNYSSGLVGTELESAFRDPLRKLLMGAPSFVPGEMRKIYDQRYAIFSNYPVSEEVKRMACSSRLLTQFLEMVHCAHRTRHDVIRVAELFSIVSDELGIDAFVRTEEQFGLRTKWEHEVRMSAYDDMRKGTVKIVEQFIERGIEDEGEIRKLLRQSDRFHTVRETLKAFLVGTPDVAVLAVYARQLGQYTLP